MKGILLALLVAAAGAAAQAADAAKDVATVMSPYEVRANSVSFQGWIKRASPNFIVYTDARESEASTVLREFEMLREAGQAVFDRKGARYSPTILILPTASSDWRKLEAKGGLVEWKSAATTAGGRVVPLLVAQYDWQSLGLGILRAVYSAIDEDRMEIAGPFWFKRGIGDFYETAEFDRDRVNLGHANPRIFALKDRRWLPWGRFFEVRDNSPEFTKENVIATYEGQAAIFTQFIFSNPDRAWIGRLTAWLDYLRAGGPPSEAQFAAIFGQDWKKWQDTMESYLAGGRYNVFQIKVAPVVMHYPEIKPELPVREVRELFVLTQTLLQRAPESETSLNALLAGGLRSQSLRELLVEACLAWGRPDAALENVRRLISDGSANARVYRLGDALLTSEAGPFNLDCRLGPELGEVRGWDRRGLELEPRYVDLNNSLAVDEACAAAVDQQSITTIEECYRRIKGRAPTDKVITALAMALWRIGETATANALAEKLESDPSVGKPSRRLAAELVRRIGGVTSGMPLR